MTASDLSHTPPVEPGMLPIQPNKSMFMRAECTPPSAWMGHIPFAGWLVEAIEPAMIVELGTHHGTSYLAFCQAVEANGLPTRCFAVDTWEGDEHAGAYGESVYAQLHGYHALKYAGFSRLMRMTFDAAAEYFDDESIDLLHIDGLHTYDAVRHDFETWLPKMSRKGVVLFHDTCVREREFGVWRFWSEVSEKYPSFEFTHSHGLGVIAVGMEIPAPLSRLLNSSGDKGTEERLLANLMAENLGRTIETDAEIRRLNHALEHEQSLRREGSANSLMQFGDVVREQAHFVRGDIVHAENLRLAGQSEIEKLQHSRLSAMEQSLRAEFSTGVDALRRNLEDVRNEVVQAVGESAEELRLSVGAGLDSRLSAMEESLRGGLSIGVDVLRRDLVTVRTQLLEVTEDARQEQREGLKQDLHTVLQAVGQSAEGLRAELLARISALLDELRDQEAARDRLVAETLADLSTSIAGNANGIAVLAETADRLEQALSELRNRGLAARWRRMTGSEVKTSDHS